MSFFSAIATATACLAMGCAVNVDLSGGSFRCSATGVCPEGQRCEAGFCTGEIVVPPDSASASCGDDQCTETCIDCAADCGACLTDSIVHWPFDSADGGAVLDASGGGKVGALEGGARVVSPRGRAISFDGTGGRAIRAADLDLVRADVAIAAWVKTPELPDLPESNREVVSYGDVYGLRVTAQGTARFFARVTAEWLVTEAATRVDDNAWHHLVGQKRGTQIELYIDGVLAASTDFADNIDYDVVLGRDLVVGRHAEIEQHFFMVGEIDEVRAFARALSPDEAAQLAE